MNQETHGNDSAKKSALYMAMELSNKSWKLGFGIGDQKCREVNVPAGDLTRLIEEVERARHKFGLGPDAPVRSCYEAGRDGFWIHRSLQERGIENVVADPASIEVPRKKRRAKTDRLDLRGLLKRLVRYHEGDPDVWSVVRVPSTDDEDERRLHRELKRLKEERTQHRNRLQGLLVTQGIALRPTAKFAADVDQVRLWNGKSLPPQLRAELLREWARLELVEAHIRLLKQEQKQRLKAPRNVGDEKAAQLSTLVGIGPEGSWILSKELFAWRRFSNRKQVGGLVGLTPTPFDSGDANIEQGISKAGNWRVRTLMTQLAWGWLRFQPQSRLSEWFTERFTAGKRVKRVGIIALARKLLVALWNYVERGVVPEGARITAPAS